MQPRNRYAFRSRLSESKFRQLVRYFSHDIDATKTSLLSGVSRVTVNRYFMAIRQAIHSCVVRPRIEAGSVELDESYFGARRVRGRRGRGAGRKTIVFGVLHRSGPVYAEIVPDVKKRTLLPLVRSFVGTKATVYTDGYPSYDGLSGMGYRHRVVNHGANVFADGERHVNGIESFWACSKRRLAKFCGVPERFFGLHLSECEFRFNHRGWKCLYKELLRLFRACPLFSAVSGTPSGLGSAFPCAAACEGSPILFRSQKPVAPRVLDNWLSWFLCDVSDVTNITQNCIKFFRSLCLYVFFCIFLL